jgi:YfiH family protein
MTLPAVPESFRWVETSSGPLLKCVPLEDIAPHVFTTRGVPLPSAFMVNQVHGRSVVVIRQEDPLPATRPDADVLVSNSQAAAIAVRAADCVPLLIADERTGAVAAVHAGWRGTAAGAAGAAVDALAREFGAKPVNLVAAIGPSIGPCCYEVGSELVDAFAAAGHARHLVDRWFSVRAGRLVLDVPGANRDQLVLAGVPEDQIHLSGLCTAEHLDVLTSYRVEKEMAGRIAGVIRARAG